MEDDRYARDVNAVVGQFYRSALSVPLQHFRESLLRDAAELVPFDAALWGTSEAEVGQFHSLTLLGLDPLFGFELEKSRDINPMYDHLIQHPDKAVDMTDMLCDEEFYASPIYRRLCRPFRIERALGASCRDPRNHVYNLIGLFRFDREHKFSADERRIQQHLTFHMTNAVSLAYSVYLGQVSSEQGGLSAAICDRHGICYDAQPSFLSLLARKFPGWQGERLPFDLPEQDGTRANKLHGLRISVTPVGDLVCVRAREDGPLDILTQREHEIVSSVCRGLSYKEVARPLGIAPSTVSNHIYRVFEKLGVTSRTELAKMFNQARHLH